MAGIKLEPPGPFNFAKPDEWPRWKRRFEQFRSASKLSAQIEKEALATTWVCEKFSTYILGSSFVIETDHKPLVPLLNTKHLDDLPPHILRFRLRPAKYEYVAHHIPGKLLYAADTLSHSPMEEEGDALQLQEEVEAYINLVTIPSIPATPQRLQELRQEQMKDPTCSRVREYCKTQWPGRDSVPSAVKPYFEPPEPLNHPNQ